VFSAWVVFPLDYRYGDYNGMMESGTTAMELITAVIDGPLCFLVVFAAAHDLSWRHPLQIILCTMQLYGLVWFTLQPIYSDTGLAGHFSSDPVSVTAVQGVSLLLFLPAVP
jgi:cholestenol delta-isomerase